MTSLPLRVATWNIESVRAHETQVLEWAARHEVDVLCLQETRADQRRFPRSGFTGLGYELVLHGGDGGYGGVAIASQVPLDDIVLGIPGAVAPLDEPRSISATVRSIRLHTCYAPNGRKVGTHHHAAKLAWLQLFATWVAVDRANGSDCLVVGDLNIAPTDLDVWDPARYRRRNLTSPDERQAFASLLAGGGLVDAARSRLGDAPGFTWWNRRSDFYESDRGWRLDHVLASANLNDRITSVTIDRYERGRPGSADHAPILCQLTC